MIESRYWKEDLLKLAKDLRPVQNPPRWSERLVVNFEKRLVMHFLLVRKLLDDNKVSRKAQSFQAKVFMFKPKGRRVTKLNDAILEKNWDLATSHPVTKGISFIANQLIHHAVLYALRVGNGDRNWDGVYVTSDREKNNALYWIPILVIAKIMEVVGSDYPEKMTYIWDNDVSDYTVITN